MTLVAVTVKTCKDADGDISQNSSVLPLNRAVTVFLYMTQMSQYEDHQKMGLHVYHQMGLRVYDRSGLYKAHCVEVHISPFKPEAQGDLPKLPVSSIKMGLRC